MHCICWNVSRSFSNKIVGEKLVYYTYRPNVYNTEIEQSRLILGGVTYTLVRLILANTVLTTHIHSRYTFLSLDLARQKIYSRKYQCDAAWVSTYYSHSLKIYFSVVGPRQKICSRKYQCDAAWVCIGGLQAATWGTRGATCVDHS